MNYPNMQTVDAEYTSCSGQANNPFLEALPDILGKDELFECVKSFPSIQDIDVLSAAQRRRLISSISSFFLPMDYMYRLYDSIYRAIETTYMTMNVLESTRQLNALYSSSVGAIPRCSYTTQAECGAILGVPGVGKTSTIRRCVRSLPQVISHNAYHGHPFYCKQITYLFVECPSDCSVKTLGFNIANAIDAAIGSNYLEQIMKSKALSASAIVLYVKQFCINHHVGVMIIDEIQNAVRTAQATKQTNRLIKFLVELMNDTCTSVFLVGTLEAEELFLKEEHLKRRTRGARLLPMTPGAEYRRFLDKLWPYQFTKKRAQLTDKFANLLYDFSGGIPAYIIKIFQEAQAQAILSGHEELDKGILTETVKILALQLPKLYTNGVSISSYAVNEQSASRLDTTHMDIEQAASVEPRGRKAQRREEQDLLVIAQKAENCDAMLIILRQLSMVEEV